MPTDLRRPAVAPGEAQTHQPVWDWASATADASSTRRPGEHDDGALALVLSLCAALDANEISYCHWKSNDVLDRSLSGENDLDLLVWEPDAVSFLDVAAELGFKTAIPAPAKRLPGVVDLYGLDTDTGRIVHLHAHFRLVVGQDHTKNYLLPLEEAYLSSQLRDGVFPIPPRELEYVVFVLRMALKHCTWETLVIGEGRLSRAETRELAHHLALIDRDALPVVLGQHFPHLSSRDFARCEAAIAAGSGRLRRIRAGNAAVRALAAHARRGRGEDVALIVGRRARHVFSRLVARRGPRRARLASGGAVIAVVGGDGAGKTTLVRGLHAWLCRDLDTQVAHLGKPPPSLTTRIARSALGAGRRLRLFPHVGQAEMHALDDRQPLPRGSFALLLRQSCRARDRARALGRARDAALTGSIVLTDRFPLPEVDSMDSPTASLLRRRLPVLPRAARFLLAHEDRHYASLGRPDVLVVLRVDPDVAVARKVDERSDEVRRRATAVWTADWSRSGAHVVDAGRPAADVLHEVKQVVWSHLAR